MKTRFISAGLLIALVAGNTGAAGSLSTVFTYQGKLTQGDSPATGIYELQATLFDAPVAGAVLAGPMTNSTVVVSNGLFASVLDFGPVFNGQNCWLEIGVRSNGLSVAFSILTPRQWITPTPYSLFSTKADQASSAVTASKVAEGGVESASLQDSAITSVKILDGTIVQSDLHPDLVGKTFWRLQGNSGTVPGSVYLGTSDNQPLEVRVNGQRALRIEPGVESPNLIGGHPLNTVASGIEGAVIGGGGNEGGSNVVMGRFGTISGGVGNLISTNAGDTTIGGGWLNTIQAFSGYATIGGGSHNIAGAVSTTVAGGYENSALAQDSTIGGGYSNAVAAEAGTIAGGFRNRVGSGYQGGFIGGGMGNHVQAVNTSIVGGYENHATNLLDGVIAGGLQNQISANHTVIAGGLHNTNAGPGASIGGGNGNLITTGGADATIAGGFGNRVEGFRSVVGGGQGNTVAASYGLLGAGEHNAILTNSHYAVVAGGRDNDVDSDSAYGAIGGGYGNAIGSSSRAALIAGGEGNGVGSNSWRSVVVGGSQNTVGDDSMYGVIGGGYGNKVAANSRYGTVPGGRFAQADHYGQWAYASGAFSAAGDAQTSVYLLRTMTSGQSTNELFLDGSSARLTLRTNSTVTFQIQVAARSDVGVSAGYEFRGVIKRSATGVTSLEGSVDTVMVKEGATALNFLVDASDTLDALVLRAVGAGGRFHWVATVKTTETRW